MQTIEGKRDLRETAQLIRRHIVRMMWIAKGGHAGGSLSIVDMLTALYFHVLRIDPHHPERDDRDRLILSKGHAAAALYAVLAEKGYFPRERLFDSFRIRIDGMLQEHPDMRKTPGIDMSTGSLGQGLSVAVGMALGRRLTAKEFRIYVLMGDGELQEGQVWEAAMAAGHYRLNEITAIVDHNRLQVSGRVEGVLGIEPLRSKWEAFHWNVVEIDGHSMEEIIAACEETRIQREAPSVIIAHTVKGKGVSFIENMAESHSMVFSSEEVAMALKELGGQEET
jgi:transketolase